MRQIDFMISARRQLIGHRAFFAGQKAGADTIGDIAEPQIETGRLNLVIQYPARRPDLLFAHHILNAMRRQNANRMGLALSHDRLLAALFGKQCTGFCRFAHDQTACEAV